MRKFFSVFLLLCTLLTLPGCKRKEEENLFYYVRKNILYGQEDGVIVPESRDIEGHEADLNYILKLYLEGPHAQELSRPFPGGTTLTELKMEDGHISVTLSDAFGRLQGIDLTLACTCIAYTCFSVSGCESVTVGSTLAGSTSITLTRNSVALTDISPATN